jgi:hypothetical protein
MRHADIFVRLLLLLPLLLWRVLLLCLLLLLPYHWLSRHDAVYCT